MLATTLIVPCVAALAGCAEGRTMTMARTDAGLDASLDTGELVAFPDAVALDGAATDALLPDAPGIDAASVDAPIPDAFRVEPDAWIMATPDAFVVRTDARLPDAAGECVEGARLPCATSCGTTGSALCTGGRIGACTPPTEICNGAEDDCRGGAEDTFACSIGRNESCSTSCGSAGVRSCGVSCAWGSCTPSSGETCNGRDENCDGAIDEGFRASVVFSTYSELFTRHPGCDGFSQRMGPDCNAAIHRLCTNGCTTSGFGPIENSGDVANVTCVIGEVRTVAYAELATFQGPCDGLTERIGMNCNAAIHRYCAASGAVSGFGPVENDAANAAITCVRSAEVRMTSYSTLASFLSVCDGVTERAGPACNAAINRYCASAGFASGFGPVENDADVAYVTCVRP